MTLHGQHKSVSFWSLCVPCYLVDSVDEKLPGLFAVGKYKHMYELRGKFVFNWGESFVDFLGSGENGPGLHPGYAGIDGKEGEFDSLLEDNEEADDLVLILENPGLSHEHEHPADHEERGHDKFVLKHALEVVEIHQLYYSVVYIIKRVTGIIPSQLY